MASIRELMTRLWAEIRRPRTERDLRSELRFHLRLEEEAGLRRGLSPREASRQAHLRAGDLTGALERLRDQQRLPLLEGTFADLRHAAGALVRRPGFAVTAIAALALAVAVNTLIFSLVNGVILRPLPYPQPERLVRIFESTRRNPKWPVSIANFRELQRNGRTLESIALYTGQDLQLMHEDRPERVRAVRISAGFLPTLGIQPMIGRNFTEAEMQGLQRVVLMSNRLWRTRFNSDPQIAGRIIRLNRASWTVVGVLPPDFQHIGGAFRSPLQGDTVALWWPLQLDLSEPAQRFWHFTNAVARLKPGVSQQQVDEDLKRIAADLGTRYPGPNANLSLRAISLATEVLGGSQQTVWLLVAAGCLVLAIAGANVAGLCIARGLARRREVAVRQALGAPAWRLVRGALCENLVLGAIGGIAGLALAAALSPAWHSLLPADFPRVHEVSLTWPSALFSVACALATSLLAGLAPALYQTMVDSNRHLTQESRSLSTGREASRLRLALVASEVAFATVLSAAAMLLLHSSLRLGQRPQGFQPSSVLTFTFSLPAAAYSKPEQFARFYEDLTSRWRALPGVRAGLASDVPWTGYDENTSFGIPGNQVERTGGPQARYHMASAGYFEALRIPLRSGRYFDERDRSDSPKVVVINETLARRYLANENPIGKTLEIWGDKWKVAGVVADIYDRPADLNAEPAFWFPLAQQPQSQLVAVLRGGAVDPSALVTPASNEMHALDRELPLAEVRPMDDIARAALGERNLANWLFQMFALLALGLAVFGIYGLLSYVVEQRYKEFGIRMALGASRSGIAWLILKSGLCQAGVGGLIGILLAPVTARSLASLLYGVTPLDPLPLMLVPALILTFSLSASLVPAIAASRAEPGVTLRTE